MNKSKQANRNLNRSLFLSLEGSKKWLVLTIAIIMLSVNAMATPRDIVFVFDRNSATPLELERPLMELLPNLPQGDRVGIVGYTRKENSVILGLSGDIEQVATSAMKLGESPEALSILDSSINPFVTEKAGLAQAFAILGSPTDSRQRVIILVTDWSDERNEEWPVLQAKSENVIINTITFEGYPGYPTAYKGWYSPYTRYSSLTGGRSYSVEPGNLAQLRRAYEAILANLNEKPKTLSHQQSAESIIPTLQEAGVQGTIPQYRAGITVMPFNSALSSGERVLLQYNVTDAISYRSETKTGIEAVKHLVEMVDSNGETANAVDRTLLADLITREKKGQIDPAWQRDISILATPRVASALAALGKPASGALVILMVSAHKAETRNQAYEEFRRLAYNGQVSDSAWMFIATVIGDYTWSGNYSPYAFGVEIPSDELTKYTSTILLCQDRGVLNQIKSEIANFRSYERTAQKVAFKRLLKSALKKARRT